MTASTKMTAAIRELSGVHGSMALALEKKKPIRKELFGHWASALERAAQHLRSEPDRN